MATKSFFEVLEDQIRTELRAEIEAEVGKRLAHAANSSISDAAEALAPHQTAGERLETWLTANIGKSIFTKREAAARAYRTKEKSSAGANKNIDTVATPPPVAEEPKVWARTAEEQFAYEILHRHGGCKLPQVFSESELKTAWRRAALKSHPDRFAQSDLITQTQMAALFREIVLAFETLSGLFDSRQEAPLGSHARAA